MKAIGIDIGTTSVCGIIIDCNSADVVKTITKNSNAFIPGNAPYEKLQSVDKIISIATDILESLLSYDICAIGIAGQMHGIVYTDFDGNAVSPLYTWQDGRGNLPYKDTTYAKYMGSFSGYGNVTDFYNRKNGIRPRNAASYCTIQDYFVMRLCGLKAPILHASNAASFGCYDLEKNSFNYDCNVKLATDYTIVGSYKGIPVAAAIGDNQASVFSALSDESDILVNIGTGSQVSMISDKPVSGNILETRPYFENKYLIVGAALCGGRAYSMLKDFFKSILQNFVDVSDDKIYEAMNNLAAGYDSSLSIDSRFAGTRKNPDITGSICAITTENLTAADFCKAMLDAISNELYDMYCESDLKKAGLVGSGNGIRNNPILVKSLESKFASSMKIPAHIEEGAFGSALYAMISCGIFSNAAQAHKLIKYEIR